MKKQKRTLRKSTVLQELFSFLGSDQNLEKEVLDLVHQNGYDPNRLTLNELRSVVASFARKVILRKSRQF